MLIVMEVANRKILLPDWKVIASGIILLPVGIIGTKLMRLVEARTWDGFSFYGAVFTVPLFMTVAAYVLRVKASSLLDICSPAGCIMLALMKINCIDVGCCRGRIIGVDQYETIVRFPSQITELIVSLILLVIILKIIFDGRQRGVVYAWFMLLYGSTRFVLNLFRETTPFILGISSGCLWSIIAVCIGGGILFYRNRGNGFIGGKV